MLRYLFLIISVFLFSRTYNIRKKGYTKKQLEAIKRKHIELSKQSHGDMYFIVNAYGAFSVCVQEHFRYNTIGKASYYDFGHITATGEKFSAKNYTAAHPFLPLPCIVEVISVKNPKNKIIVKVNDRGPFIQNPEVIIDLTKQVAKELGFLHHGLLLVKVVCLEAETMMLVEHGGDLVWDGTIPFELALKRSKLKLKRNYSSKNKI